MEKKTKVVGGGVVAAAAAAAVGIAVARRKNGEPQVWHVRPDGEGWAVMRDGNERATSTHATKKEAVSAGRRSAGAAAPSTLVLHYADGKEQRRIEYAAE